jgi:sugar transferase (PEP-CTERM/EpsH1 system associated)
MRLLFLTPQYPYPPHKGTTLRNYNVIAGLAARHEIDLLTFVESRDQLAVPSPLNNLCDRIAGLPGAPRPLSRRALDTLLSPWPDMGLRLWSIEFQQQLQAWLADRSYDVIQIEGIELARYGLSLLPISKPLIVFDNHNAEYLLQQRIAATEFATRGLSLGAIYSSIQTRKLRGFEQQICRRVDRVVAVSEADAAAIEELDPALKVAVIPNGVDTTFYRRADVHPAELPPQALVFTGTMDFRPNVDAVLWFAQAVLPLIRETVTEAHFVIVGRRPHARLDVLRSDPAVTITGAVEDIRPYIAAAAVYVVPMRMGGGTRLKVLEATSMEAAVVSTTLGAEGFPVVSGRELLLADDPPSFARAVIDLLQQPQRRAALGQAGRSFAVEQYEWRKIVPKFEEVYSA